MEEAANTQGLRRGDVVSAGGPYMTVNRFSRGFLGLGKLRAQCIWFDEHSRLHRAWFPLGSLTTRI